MSIQEIRAELRKFTEIREIRLGRPPLSPWPHSRAASAGRGAMPGKREAADAALQEEWRIAKEEAGPQISDDVKK